MAAALAVAVAAPITLALGLRDLLPGRYFRGQHAPDGRRDFLGSSLLPVAPGATALRLGLLEGRGDAIDTVLLARSFGVGGDALLKGVRGRTVDHGRVAKIRGDFLRSENVGASHELRFRWFAFLVYRLNPASRRLGLVGRLAGRGSGRRSADFELSTRFRD